MSPSTASQKVPNINIEEEKSEQQSNKPEKQPTEVQELGNHPQ